MSGHSKWHNIRRKKEAMDAKRGKIFSKLIREIQVAVRSGGPDPEGNAALKKAIERAKSNNMPKDTIESAIKKAAGETGGANFEERFYEGFGHGNVAIYVRVLTDNRNRATTHLRTAFNKNGGHMAEKGSVGWMFEEKGYILVSGKGVDEDEVLEVVLEAGGDDVKRSDDENFEVFTDVESFSTVRDALAQKGFEIISSDITFIPKTTVKITDKETARKLLKLLQAIEDLDDVQEVYANFDIPEDILEEIGK
jgi:YebC/PmpR family DNA-binding regulatory protein